MLTEITSKCQKYVYLQSFIASKVGTTTTLGIFVFYNRCHYMYRWDRHVQDYLTIQCKRGVTTLLVAESVVQHLQCQEILRLTTVSTTTAIQHY